MKFQSDSVLRPLFKNIVDERIYTLICNIMDDAPKVDAVPLDWIFWYTRRLDNLDQTVVRQMVEKYMEENGDE